MKRRLVGVVAAAVLGTVLTSGTGLNSAAAAAPVPTTVTLPLFGVPFTIGITTGPGGALTEVTVDPADGTVATQLKAHKVVFETANPLDSTDVARVVVKSGNGGQKVSARAGSLADIVGPGVWSGDVFGDGTTSIVKYAIAAAADGSPDITVITATGATAVVGTVEHSSGEGGDDEIGQSARVAITFTNGVGDQSRTLSIRVKVENAEGKAEAKLSLALGRIKGVAVDAATAAGPHTWTGTLCGGSIATINYTVAEDGSVSDVTVAPAAAEVRTRDDRIEVRFTHDERVRIRVRADHGLIKISVEARLRCNSADATTNVSTSIPADNDNGGTVQQGGGANHGHGDHAGANDDATTTTGG